MSLLFLVFSLSVCTRSSALSIDQWGRTSIDLVGPKMTSDFNPFDSVTLFGNFIHTSSKQSLRIRGFYDGESTYKIRFMPTMVGEWTYTTESNVNSLDKQLGTITATKSKSRGIASVDPSNPKAFIWSDGTPYFPVGSTAYAWVQSNTSIQQTTLSTLGLQMNPKQFGFNKLRTLVFPKWEAFTHTEPDIGYAYEGTPPNKWNFRRFNVSYFQLLDKLFADVARLDIMIEIILFHPYDQGHWGFDCMGGRDPNTYNTSNDEHYLKYFIARVASYRHVWWSLANEFSNVKCKSKDGPTRYPIWDRLFQVLAAEDPYGHERSIHNGRHHYNYTEPWVTHISLQSTYTPAPDLWKQYKVVKPVTWDEFQYEGDIPEGWGNKSAQVETDRFWKVISYGGYAAGHSECILENGVPPDQQIMWWNHGNVLRGHAPPRIKFFHEYMVNSSRHPLFHELTQNQPVNAVNILEKKDEYYLIHFENNTHGQHLSFPLKSGISFQLSRIEYFNMKITHLKDVQDKLVWSNPPRQPEVLELIAK